MVNTLCIVQARLTSSRLPNKVLTKLGNSNLTILEHVYNRLKKVEHIDEIVFAIPDTPLNDKLSNFLLNKNIKYFRGSENDVLSRFYDCALLYSPQKIVRATCDNPLVDWILADKMLADFYNLDYMYCNTTSLGTSIEIFTMKSLLDAYQNAKSEHDREHVTPYIRNNNSNKCRNFVYNNTNFRLTVDEEDDLKLMNKIYSELYVNEPIDNNLVYEFLMKNKKLIELNVHVHQKK